MLLLCVAGIAALAIFIQFQCTHNAVEILNYFDTNRTNTILEGFISKISIIKNRARGFRNMKNFRDDLLLLW